MRYLLREARCWHFMSRHNSKEHSERSFAGRTIPEPDPCPVLSGPFCMFCRGWRGPRIQTLTPLEILQRVCDLMGGHICYCEFKMQQGCLLFLRCMCSEKHRCSADSEVRVPSTESKTSFPAAPQLILWDLQPRRGQRSWGHRTKIAGQPQAQAYLCSDNVCRQKRTLWSRGLLPAGSKDNSCNWFEKPDKCSHRVTWERGCTCAVVSTWGLRIWERCRGCSLKAPCTQFRQDDVQQLGQGDSWAALAGDQSGSPGWPRS